jgi:uncharacterized protein (TIGR03790 family)
LHGAGIRASFAAMKFSRVFPLALAVLAQAARADIRPEAVAIVYNSNVPESRALAETYRTARGIPFENVVSLDIPPGADISREDFDRSILKPLRQTFDSKGWWRRQRGADGITLPVANKIRVLVTMRGVPLRIKATAKPEGGKATPQNPIAGHDEAAVDSELAMFGAENLSADGVLQNKFYNSEKSISAVDMPYLVLTARIDAPTQATCERMIRDAVEAERTGLWGRAYVDIANKIPQGDQWLETVVAADAAAGIPTVVDRFNPTFPKNYPMTGAALYYGWYDWDLNGPFLNSRFQFRKGAVAMHLHSFSAMQLTNPATNWSGGLLEKGAAVTIGNVYEPYLHLTHDFGILHRRLLEGFTWVEACWMAMPVTSWQGVVLGDPLYRPFLHLDGSGEIREEDIPYRALRAAAVKWKSDPRERLKQLDAASSRMRSGVLAEDLGLEAVERKDPLEAKRWFQAAKGWYTAAEDKMRQDFNMIAIDRAAGRKDEALQAIKDAALRYGPIPESEALAAWQSILDPPPPRPPPAPKDPGKP